MLRMIGLLLLTVGTGIAAVFGAWLPGGDRPDHHARMVAEAHADMAKNNAKKGVKSSTTGNTTGNTTGKPPRVPLGDNGAALTRPHGTAGIQLWANEAGLPFGGGILLVIIGVILARRGMRNEADAAHAETSTAATAPGPLFARLVEELERLEDVHSAELPDLRAVRVDIERVQQAILSPLVEGRDRLSREFGVGAYAEIFVPFSAAERQVNRVWSACVDGYVDEISPCLARATASAKEANTTYIHYASGEGAGTTGSPPNVAPAARG